MWDFFDKIYCINVQSRPDRYEKMRDFFKAHGIPVEFYRPAKHPRSGMRGCFESHRELCRRGLEMSCQRILVFEDDIHTKVAIDSHYMAHAIDFMEKNFFELFFLGVVPDVLQHASSRVAPHVYKTVGIGGHAVVYSRSFMRWFSKIEWTPGYDIDGNKKTSFGFSQYALYPGIFYQDKKDSDITDIHGIVFRAVGALKGLAPAIEWYAYRIGMPLPVLVAIVILIISAILRAKRKI